MAHQIVATSVPRGLDGVSGYQTVLKSAGIPPRVFDRLKARSGYSHPFPHGDSRNPVVYIHRIEEMSGSRWHVLGCVRDAGSDHTGRSNFLAHMLAVDAAEARGKPGGPAAAALVRGCFLDKWDRPPEPAAAAKTLVAADRPPQPADVPAWTAAGLDPGIAGDLAAAAMANRKVVIVTRPGDDVLALFADALRMVEPSKRWGVTFNTCAIEDFDGTWKAVRADLADAKDLRDGKATLIDLTTNPRGSADAYAKFARGEADVLPWQTPIAAPDPTNDRQTRADDAAATAPLKPNVAGKEADQKKAGNATAGTEAGGRREPRPRYEEEPVPAGPWRAIAIGLLGLLLIAALAAIPFRDELLALVRPQEPRPLEPPAELADTPVTQPASDGKDNPEWHELEKVKDAKTRLAKGIEGKTHDALREEAEALLQRIDGLREGREGGDRLRIVAQDGLAPDPRLGVEAVVKTCDELSGILETASGLKLDRVKQVETDFKTAVASLAGLRKQVDDLEKAERGELAQKRVAEEARARDDRRQRAFADFQSIGKAVSLPVAAARSDIDGTSPPVSGSTSEIDLGPFAFADLVGPNFRLAIPHDTIERAAFKADVVSTDGAGDPTWEIRYKPSGVTADGSPEKPRLLARLIVRKGRLVLEVPRAETGLPPLALLRRSVILAEAKDPASPAAPPVVQEIRLVQPTKVKPLVIDLFAERRQELKIVPPAGIARNVSGPTGPSPLAIPIQSLRFEADFPKGEKVSIELPKDVREGTDPGIGEWQILLAQLNPELAIHAAIQLSLPQATLTVETVFDGPRAKLYLKPKVKEFFIDTPDAKLKALRQTFFGVRIKRGTGYTFTTKQTRPRDIEQWFDTPLASSRGGGMGVDVPDHETVKKSFIKYLKEDPKQQKLPADWATFFRECEGSKEEQWKQLYTDRIVDWSDWFWTQFESHWNELVKQFRGALAERHAVKITGITSLAYDESGQVYEVPLVVLDAQPASMATPGPAGPPKAASSDSLD